MSDYSVIVSFTAPEHSGKTTLEAVFAKILGEHGITVHMPPDPQRDAKMNMSTEDLLAAFRAKNGTVLFIESNAT
jgi:molybdopterin-guanine dinucleotide biosynthesis protein